MAKEWDRQNMRSIAANVKAETAEAFKKYAEEHGTTMGALMRGFIQSTLEQPKETPVNPSNGVPHLVSYKNTDLLKAETAHHNPGNLNPDGVLNEILDEYFRFVKRIRR